jgi:phosphate-selective porin OprO and OprP
MEITVRRPILIAAALATMTALAAPQTGTAQDSLATINQQLQTLEEALAAQQRMLQQQAAEIQRLQEQLRNMAASSAKLAEAQHAAHDAKPVKDEQPRITSTGPRPIITSADGRNSFAPRAVVQLDMANYSEDGDRGANDFRRGSVGATGNRETNAARDLSDGAYFRRARLGFEGIIARDFNYRILLELGGAGSEGPARINDAWISYSGFAPFTLQLGAFSPAANMDDGTSVENLVFIERASAAELSRVLGGADGRIGLGVRGSGSRWMSSLTLTTRTVNDAEVFDSQLAAVARAGLLVATSSEYNIHAGLSGTWVQEPADQGSAAGAARTPLRFRDRPELRVDSTRLIDTGSIDADGGYAAAVEFGANWKNFYFQAENFWYGIERPESSPLDDPSFGGYYAQASWVITGESRRYDAANGSFQAPRAFAPFSAAGGVGAWELALRHSRMDLNFHAGTPGTAALADGVRGGEQSIWTLGVNWYLNQNFRLLFNYLRIDVDRLNPAGPGNLTPFGPAPATPPLGVPIGQELDVVAVRSQFSF